MVRTYLSWIRLRHNIHLQNKLLPITPTLLLLGSPCSHAVFLGTLHILLPKQIYRIGHFQATNHKSVSINLKHVTYICNLVLIQVLIAGQTTKLIAFWQELRDQCDQIGRFIEFWATFQSLWQQIICPNHLHSQAIFVKVSKSLI